ncbi:ABC transporter ATP-binding protein [Streptomyces albus]|uniref:ABC transporter ATP-binding protein n=1 Tax=Streptomyces albus TaxID=1888 RepID=UPI000AAAB7F0|nr:ABC transporter ATP-binding protein [Streptomyces albus]
MSGPGVSGARAGRADGTGSGRGDEHSEDGAQHMWAGQRQHTGTATEPAGQIPDTGRAGAEGTASRLSGGGLTLAYDRRTVAEDLTVAIPDRSFTVIIGPNACGKSTLLRALSRMLKPAAGSVLLDGRDISATPAKQVARTLGLLPQSSIAPDGIGVSELVSRGRYPHQGLLRQWSSEDERVVAESMAATGVTDLADRTVDELSGGQRQRVWIAMALAQQTPLLLLDEPTTFLDLAHQIEILDLCARLHEEEGRTLVAVLHDLNHAARYATHLIAMREGRIVASGPPAEIVTADLVEEVFGLPCRVIDDPETGTPLVVPAARRRGPGPAARPAAGPEAGPAAGPAETV